jgi:hypothetical protein
MDYPRLGLIAINMRWVSCKVHIRTVYFQFPMGSYLQVLLLSEPVLKVGKLPKIELLASDIHNPVSHAELARRLPHRSIAV